MCEEWKFQLESANCLHSILIGAHSISATQLDAAFFNWIPEKPVNFSVSQVAGAARLCYKLVELSGQTIVPIDNQKPINHLLIILIIDFRIRAHNWPMQSSMQRFLSTSAAAAFRRRSASSLALMQVADFPQPRQESFVNSERKWDSKKAKVSNHTMWLHNSWRIKRLNVRKNLSNNSTGR